MKKKYVVIFGLLVLIVFSIVTIYVKQSQAQTLHGIQFTWTEPSGGTPAATFNLYCATTAGGEGTTPTVTGITSSPFLWSSGTPGTTYFCKISAVSSIGEESALSNEATQTFPGAPQTPTGFGAAQK